MFVKNAIDLFSELGVRLRGFGDDNATRGVVNAACRANGWFTPAEVRRAVGAIARDMLSREKLEAWLANYPAVPVATPRRVLVVMAGNIPLVGFFDLLCTVVSGPLVPDKALGQGYRADGVYRRPAPGY